MKRYSLRISIPKYQTCTNIQILSDVEPQAKYINHDASSKLITKFSLKPGFLPHESIHSMQEFLNAHSKSIHELERARIRKTSCGQAPSQEKLIEFYLSRISAKDSLHELFQKWRVVLLHDSKFQLLPDTENFIVPRYDNLFMRLPSNNCYLVPIKNTDISLSHDGICAASISWIRKRPRISLLQKMLKNSRNRIINSSKFVVEGFVKNQRCSYGVDVLNVGRMMKFLSCSFLFKSFCGKYIPPSLRRVLKTKREQFFTSYLKHKQTLSDFKGSDIVENERLSELLILMSLCFSINECLTKAFHCRAKISPLDIVFRKSHDIVTKRGEYHHTKKYLNRYHNNIMLRGACRKALKFFGWAKCQFSSVLIQASHISDPRNSFVCVQLKLS